MTMSLSPARPMVALCSLTPTTRPANGPVSKLSLAGGSPPSCGRACSASVSLVAGPCGGDQAGMIEVASVPPASDAVPLPASAPAGADGHWISVDTAGLAAAGGSGGAGCGESQVGAPSAGAAVGASHVGAGVPGAGGGSSQVGAGTAGRSGA